MDPYILLEVPHTASIDDIKHAYRRLAKKWHPDTNGESKEAEDMFKKIKAAYDCLINPIKRAAEDLKRKHREQAEAARQAKAAANHQAQAKNAQSVPRTKSGIGPWVIALAVLTLIAVVVAVLRYRK